MVNFNLWDFLLDQILPACMLWDHLCLASLAFSPVTSQCFRFLGPHGQAAEVEPTVCKQWCLLQSDLPLMLLFASELVLPKAFTQTSPFSEQDFCYLHNISCKFLASLSTFGLPEPGSLQIM